MVMFWFRVRVSVRLRVRVSVRVRVMVRLRARVRDSVRDRVRVRKERMCMNFIKYFFEKRTCISLQR